MKKCSSLILFGVLAASSALAAPAGAATLEKPAINLGLSVALNSAAPLPGLVGSGQKIAVAGDHDHDHDHGWFTNSTSLKEGAFTA